MKHQLKEFSTPYVMERDEAAQFLGMSERELIARSKEPHFPRYSGYWGRWYFKGSDLEEWKAANKRTPVQLELPQNKGTLTLTDEMKQFLREVASEAIIAYRKEKTPRKLPRTKPIRRAYA